MIGIWGHRGARGLFPDNTLEGIDGALALGVDGVELDVGLTEDGIAVLSHEPRVARGSALLRHLRADELARLAGTRIPPLRSALRSGARMVIELKTFPDRPDDTAAPSVMADAVAAEVDRAGAAVRVCIESFDWRGPRHLRRTRPDLRLAWLTRAATERAARLWWDGPAPGDYGGSVPRAVAAEGANTGMSDIWAPDYRGLTRRRVEEAHALGLRVLAWTVNHPADMLRLRRWGVDGLITDRPDIARAVLIPYA